MKNTAPINKQNKNQTINAKNKIIIIIIAIHPSYSKSKYYTTL